MIKTEKYFSISSAFLCERELLQTNNSFLDGISHRYKIEEAGEKTRVTLTSYKYSDSPTLNSNVDVKFNIFLINFTISKNLIGTTQ